MKVVLSMIKRALTEEEKGFIQGVAWGVALCTRYEIGADTMLLESGIPLKDFIAAGVIDHDLKPIRKLFREINRK
jgi:hypothetical protein